VPDLKDLLQKMRAQDASDLHLRVGMPPTYRINGKLIKTDYPTLEPEEMDVMIGEVLSRSQMSAFDEEMEFDTALDLPELGRYRVNAYRQRNNIAIVFRAIKSAILDFKSLNLPQVLSDICMRQRGLILVTGATGTGKSTTLAAMIEYINEHSNMNIVTIEDPIEFVHDNRNCIIAQREVGSDTLSFNHALRRILRQDPDVILIGEIRDMETMTVALKAADSGHLVLTTLHTVDATQTVNRVISFFPLDQQQHVRLLFSTNLEAIVSQRLLPMSDGKGRIPAVEVLIATAAVRDNILDAAKSHLIPALIEAGTTQYGMQTFDQALLQLFQRGLVDLQVAKKFSTHPGDFELKVAGIVGASDRSLRFFDQEAEGLEPEAQKPQVEEPETQEESLEGEESPKPSEKS
jgi:twitching motility protein PilT